MGQSLEEFEKQVELELQEEMATEKGTAFTEDLTEKELEHIPAGQVKKARPGSNKLEQLLTRIFGRLPTEQQIEDTLKELKVKPDFWDKGTEDEFVTKDWPHGKPTEAKKGSAPLWMKILGGHYIGDVRLGLKEFQPTTEDHLRYQNIETQPQGMDYLRDTLNESKQDIRFLQSIEGLTPGITAKTIGNNLAHAYNKQNKTDYTPEDFDIAFVKGHPTFLDPQTKKRVSFNDFVPEWNDVAQYYADAIPFFWMAGGTAVGATSTLIPVFNIAASGTVTIGLEGLGAYVGTLFKRHGAYQRAGWRRLGNEGWVDPSKIKDSVMSSQDEGFNAKYFVSDKDIKIESIPDGLWALGGSAVFRGLYHVGRGVGATFTAAALGLPIKKSYMLRGAVDENEFLRAVETFAKTNLAKDLTFGKSTYVTAGQVYSNYAKSIFAQAKRLDDLGNKSEADKLRKIAGETQMTAEKLLLQESAFAAQGGGPIALLKIHQSNFLKNQFGKELQIDYSKLGDPDYLSKLGLSVEEAVIAQSNNQLKQQFSKLYSIENNLRAEFDQIIRTSTSFEDAMVKIQKMSSKIMKTEFDDLDNLYTTIGNRLNNKLLAKNKSTKVFDLSSVPALQKSITALKNKLNKNLLSKTISDKERKVITQAQENLVKFEGGKSVDWTTLQTTLTTLKKARAENTLGSEWDSVIESLTKVRKVGLKNFDKANKTKLSAIMGEADNTSLRINNFWYRDFMHKVVKSDRGVFATDKTEDIFNALLPANATKAHLTSIAKIINRADGGDIKVLLKDGLKNQWKKEVLESVDEKTALPTIIPTRFSQKVMLGLEQKKPSYVTVGGKKYKINLDEHEKFMEKHLGAAESLFSKAELKNFSNALSFSKSLNLEMTATKNLVEKLNKFPWGEGITHVEIGSPHKLLMMFLNKENPADIGKVINMVVKQHTKSDGTLSRQGIEILEGLKSAGMKHIFDKSGGVFDDIAGVYRWNTAKMNEILLGKNRDFYALLYGKGNKQMGAAHLDRMRTILAAMEFVKQTGIKGGEGMQAFPWFTAGNPAFEAMRWAVGVLNRKARALTGIRRTLGVAGLNGLEEALADPAASYWFIKLMRKSYTEKEAMDILGAQFGLHIDEISEGQFIWGDQMTSDALDLEAMEYEKERLPMKKGGTIRKWSEGLDKMFNMPSQTEISEFLK